MHSILLKNLLPPRRTVNGSEIDAKDCIPKVGGILRYQTGLTVYISIFVLLQQLHRTQVA